MKIILYFYIIIFMKIVDRVIVIKIDGYIDHRLNKNLKNSSIRTFFKIKYRYAIFILLALGTYKGIFEPGWGRKKIT